MDASKATALQAHLTRLLQSRAHPKTICPSEAARAMSASELNQAGVKEWRDLMPGAREILFDMRDQGEVDILQKGEVLDGDIREADIKGPIRARLSRSDEQN